MRKRKVQPTSCFKHFHLLTLNLSQAFGFLFKDLEKWPHQMASPAHQSGRMRAHTRVSVHTGAALPLLHQVRH